MDYTPEGKPVVNPNSTDTRFKTKEYDAYGRFAIESDNAKGETSYVQYDPRWGTPMRAEGKDGNYTLMTYDEFGRTKQVTSPSGYNVDINIGWDVRNGTGHSISDATDAKYYIEKIHPANPNEKVWYNSTGLSRMSSYQDFAEGDGNFIESLLVNRYDERRQIVQSTYPTRQGEQVLTNTYSYDDYNRLVGVITPTGNSTNIYTAAEDGSYVKKHIREDGKEEINTYDAIGEITSSIDIGGSTTAYSYFSHNGLKEVVVGGSTTSIDYDIYGRQTSLTEPNLGTIDYGYNGFGEMVYFDDQKPGESRIWYDIIGRVDQITKFEGATDYQYVESGNGLNKLKKIINYNGYEESFVYDHLNRLTHHTELVNSQSFTHQYSYNEYDQMIQLNYPSGFSTSYEYADQTGYLMNIKGHDGRVIYKPKASNRYGQMTEYELGNGISSLTDYDDYGIIDRHYTDQAGVFDMTYVINVQNGLMNSRTDNVHGGQKESFTYDAYERLETVSLNGIQTLEMQYEENGNIKFKSDISEDFYQYNTPRPHAVSTIPNPKSDANIPQTILYDSESQPIQINQGGKELHISYGSDDLRRYSVMTDSNSPDPDPVYQRYYISNYEQQIDQLDNVSNVHYLEAGVIVVQENGGAFTYYYTYGDHLGSIMSITDQQGNVVADQSYDAWGRSRDPSDWTNYTVNSTPLSWLNRGYTGHEMLPEFGLINMNGRLYDNHVARMLSPDHYAGMDGTSQGYNRYSYVYNNPLRYTDPSGMNGAICQELGVAFGAMGPDVVFTSTRAAGNAGSSYNPTGVLASAASSLAADIFSFDNDHYNDAGGSSASSDQIIIRGANNSSITVNNEYINFDVSVEGLGIDFGGNYDLDGDEILHAMLDIVGVVDQTGIADAINAVLYLEEGNYLDAAQSAGGTIPIIGDVAKINRVKKSYKTIEKAIDSGKTIAKKGKVIDKRSRNSDGTPFKIGKRNMSSRKKSAYEKAKKESKGNEPIGPEDHGHGPHYHPSDPSKPGQRHPTKGHDHYYFPKKQF